MTNLTLTSPAFAEGRSIPTKHTGDGKDVSPALQWGGVPDGSRSLALICDDPDAPVGTWVHWVLFNVPPTIAELPENVPPAETVANGAKQGRNDFGHLGYGGPAPPPGRPHRYFFKLYALDCEVALRPGAAKRELVQAIEGHVLAEAQLMGIYQRPR